MGFLIFAYRKLFLKRRINDLQYREMVLQQKKMNATEQIGNYQSAVSYQNNIFQAGFQGQVYNLMKQYPQNPQDPGNSVFMQEYSNLMGAYQQRKAAMEYQEQMQMQQIKNADTQIEQQMASIESQLKLMTAELESVEKGEDQEAKQAAPKFGLS